MANGMPPASKDPFAETAAQDAMAKEEVGISLEKGGELHGLGVEQRIENLYELIASMEFYSTVLCDQIAHAEKKIAALKQEAAMYSHVTEPDMGAKHSLFVERNLTRRSVTRRNLIKRRNATRRQRDLI